MRKSLIAASVLCLVPLGAFASAHDTITPHASRGACEQALARINNVDRADARPFSKEFGFTLGDVNRYFHIRFQCEKRGSNWFIIDNIPEDGQ